MKVTTLFEYPVKGLRGHKLSCASVNKRGLNMDRRWMLVDDKGEFISQRKHPGLTQFTTTFDDQLKVEHVESQENIEIDLAAFNQKTDVEVWGQACTGHFSTNGVNEWFSRLLNEPVRLVYMDDTNIRPINSSTNDGFVSFADGYPVLLTSEASLAELNERLDGPVNMARFRSNIVIDGDLPYQEDDWRELKIGSVRFKVAKHCARCQVINIDQESGVSSQEPLRTLATYRTVNNGVNFGVNMIPLSTGNIHKGDEVDIVA